LHNEELHNLYCSPDINQIKEDEIHGMCNSHGGDD